MSGIDYQSLAVTGIYESGVAIRGCKYMRVLISPKVEMDSKPLTPLDFKDGPHRDSFRMQTLLFANLAVLSRRAVESNPTIISDVKKGDSGIFKYVEHVHVDSPEEETVQENDEEDNAEEDNKKDGDEVPPGDDDSTKNLFEDLWGDDEDVSHKAGSNPIVRDEDSKELLLSTSDEPIIEDLPEEHTTPKENAAPKTIKERLEYLREQTMKPGHRTDINVSDKGMDTRPHRILFHETDRYYMYVYLSFSSNLNSRALDKEYEKILSKVKREKEDEGEEEESNIYVKAAVNATRNVNKRKKKEKQYLEVTTAKQMGELMVEMEHYHSQQRGTMERMDKVSTVTSAKPSELFKTSIFSKALYSNYSVEEIMDMFCMKMRSDDDIERMDEFEHLINSLNKEAVPNVLNMRGKFYEIPIEEFKDRSLPERLLPNLPDHIVDFFRFAFRDAKTMNMSMDGETQRYLDSVTKEDATKSVHHVRKSPLLLLSEYHKHIWEVEEKGVPDDPKKIEEGFERMEYLFDNTYLRKLFPDTLRAVLEWGDSRKDEDGNVQLSGEVFPTEEGLDPLSRYILACQDYMASYNTVDSGCLPTVIMLLCVMTAQFDWLLAMKPNVLIVGERDKGKSDLVTQVLRMSIQGMARTHTSAASARAYNQPGYSRLCDLEFWDEAPNWVHTKESKLGPLDREHLSQMKSLLTMGFTARDVANIDDNGKRNLLHIKDHRFLMMIVLANSLTNTNEALNNRFVTKSVISANSCDSANNVSRRRGLAEARDKVSNFADMPRSIQYVCTMLHFACNFYLMDIPSSDVGYALAIKVIEMLYKRGVEHAGSSRGVVRVQSVNDELTLILSVLKLFMTEGGEFHKDQKFNLKTQYKTFAKEAHHTKSSTSIALSLFAEQFVDEAKCKVVESVITKYTGMKHKEMEMASNVHETARMDQEFMKKVISRRDNSSPEDNGSRKKEKEDLLPDPRGAKDLIANDTGKKGLSASVLGKRGRDHRDHEDSSTVFKKTSMYDTPTLGRGTATERETDKPELDKRSKLRKELQDKYNLEPEAVRKAYELLDIKAKSVLSRDGQYSFWEEDPVFRKQATPNPHKKKGRRPEKDEQENTVGSTHNLNYIYSNSDHQNREVLYNSIKSDTGNSMPVSEISRVMTEISTKPQYFPIWFRKINGHIFSTLRNMYSGDYEGNPEKRILKLYDLIGYDKGVHQQLVIIRMPKGSNSYRVACAWCSPKFNDVYLITRCIKDACAYQGCTESKIVLPLISRVKSKKNSEFEKIVLKPGPENAFTFRNPTYIKRESRIIVELTSQMIKIRNKRRKIITEKVQAPVDTDEQKIEDNVDKAATDLYKDMRNLCLQDEDRLLNCSAKDMIKNFDKFKVITDDDEYTQQYKLIYKDLDTWGRESHKKRRPHLFSGEDSAQVTDICGYTNEPGIDYRMMEEFEESMDDGNMVDEFDEPPPNNYNMND